MALERTALDSVQQRVRSDPRKPAMTTWPVVWYAFSDAIRTYYLDMTDRDPQHVTVGDVRLFLTHRAKVFDSSVWNS